MSSPPKPEYVLFISNCQFSNNFVNKLRTKEELAKKFNIVDINKIPSIPNEIEEVPCVYDGKQIYQGKDAFSWLNEKMGEYLSPANDGSMYSFLDGQEEKVFGNYSFLDQKNGSHGMGEQPSPSNMNDPTRMMKIDNNDNKNRTLDSLMAARSSELQNIK
uniref:Glutaredoxin domain-containing protein n=1 Tax=viral metagenome TaxID=1070528 RepID=A0A6C0B027_9ZZZZ